MSISNRFHSDPIKFAGFPISEIYEIGEEVVAPAEKFAHHLGVEYESETAITEQIESFLSHVDPSKVQAIFLDEWDSMFDSGPDEALGVLIANAAKLSNLKHVAFGVVGSEICEISWINQADYTDFIAAYPQLETLHFRGANGLVLPATTYTHLKSLTIESGGLGQEILNQLAGSQFPKLEHLSLWLGTDEYGLDYSAEEAIDLIDKIVSNCPQLKHLEIANTEIITEMVPSLIQKNWIKRLEQLSFAGGNLQDAGAQAIVDSETLSHLKLLDLNHHFIGEELQDALKDKFGDRVDVSDAQEADDYGDDELYYHILVSE